MFKNFNLFETNWDLMSQVALVVKNLLANAGNIKDTALIPGSIL